MRPFQNTKVVVWLSSIDFFVFIKELLKSVLYLLFPRVVATLFSWWSRHYSPLFDMK